MSKTIKICEVDGCESKVKARNLCSKHYRRKMEHGDVHTVLKRVNSRKRGYKCELQIARDEMKKYGEKFKRLRQSTGMNQGEFADLVGTHQTNISRWERGFCVPHVDINYIERKIESVVKQHLRQA